MEKLRVASSTHPPRRPWPPLRCGGSARSEGLPGGIGGEHRKRMRTSPWAITSSTAVTSRARIAAPVLQGGLPRAGRSDAGAHRVHAKAGAGIRGRRRFPAPAEGADEQDRCLRAPRTMSRSGATDEARPARSPGELSVEARDSGLRPSPASAEGPLSLAGARRGRWPSRGGPTHKPAGAKARRSRAHRSRTEVMPESPAGPPPGRASASPSARARGPRTGDGGEALAVQRLDADRVLKARDADPAVTARGPPVGRTWLVPEQ